MADDPVFFIDPNATPDSGSTSGATDTTGEDEETTTGEDEETTEASSEEGMFIDFLQ